MKAANREAYEQELEIIKTSCYKDDLNFDQLEQQLPLSVNLVQQALPDVNKVTSVRTTIFPRIERARSINFRLAPRGVVFEGAL